MTSAPLDNVAAIERPLTVVKMRDTGYQAGLRLRRRTDGTGTKGVA